jgi:hypothetical protein
MRGYFGLGQLSATEKQDILDQHKSLYNGYKTMQPEVSNTQPLYVYDFAGDKDGMVVNNKGEVKKYTNMGINEQVESKDMCEQCGGQMTEGICEQCNTEGEMEEGVGKLDDIYDEQDLDPSGGFDYIEGPSNDVDTFEKMHKNLYKEDEYEDTDNEDDGFEDIQAGEEMEEQGYTGGGNAPDMDLSNIDPGYDFESDGPDQFQKSSDNLDVEDEDEESETPAFDFESGGPNSGYPVFEDDMYGYDPEKDYETMESAWDDDEGELDEQPDISGAQGIYGAMKKAYDFDSDGPGKGGPYQEFSYESELDEEDEFEEVDEDLKESLINQKNKIIEMFNRIKKYN